MTSTQYRVALRRLGLSQVGAATLFGANERTSRYWASGARAIPPGVDILLKLLVAGKITSADIEAVK
jgi:hypothetical protein